MSETTHKAGQQYQDNDPRAGDRVVIIKSISGDVATCSSSTSNRDTWIRLGALHQDGKPRRTGFSLLPALEPFERLAYTLDAMTGASLNAEATPRDKMCDVVAQRVNGLIQWVRELEQERTRIRKAAEELAEEFGITAEYTEALICGTGDKWYEVRQSLEQQRDAALARIKELEASAESAERVEVGEPQAEKCPRCGGTGSITRFDTYARIADHKVCPTCKGTG